jgi:CRISPR-associated protein Cas1
MGLLLIDEQGAHVRREGERFVVSLAALDLIEVRVSDVDSIVLCGRVEATSGALDLAMSREIPVCFLTSTGKYRGTLLPPCDSGARLRRRQYDVLAREELRLELARSILLAQVANQCAVVRRFGLRREDPHLGELLEALRDARRAVADVRSIEALRGVEGHASRLVFEAVSTVIDPALGFTHRAVRHGADPFNVVLDVLGGLLASSATGAVMAARLDPYEGAMHGDARGAPALALDLEDVYRPLLVTAVAVTLLSKRVLRARDFAVIPGGRCQLTVPAVGRVCAAFANACRREVRGCVGGPRASYLRHLLGDARGMAHWFRHPEESFRPLTVK